MNRYFPTINQNYGSPFVEMDEDSLGDYVKVDDVILWLQQQRNNVICEKMLDGLLHELSEGI